MHTAPTDLAAAALLRRLGSFWSGIFTGQEQLLSLFRARAQHAAQEYLNFMESLSCSVFTDIPVFHRELWGTAVITESELKSSPLRYGENGVTFGGGYVYGQSRSKDLYMPLPAGLKDVAFLHDNPLHPSFTYTRGVEFHIADGFLYFHKDPFQEAGVVALYENGEQVDRGLTLWLQNADYDRSYLISHLGSSLRLFLASSSAAKLGMNALARLYTSFPSRAYLGLFLAAITDSPCCLGDVETVEHVVDYPAKLIITDKRVYRAGDDAVVIVAEGDRLLFGDMMTDAVSLLELAYRLPTSEELPVVTCGQAMLIGQYKRELVFPNRVVPVVKVDGKQRFEVLGDPDDVALFWERADSGNGLSYNGDMVNPAQLMLSCLKGHGLLVKLSAQSFGPLAFPDVFVEFVRKVLSPRLVLLSYTETSVPVVHDVFPGSEDILEFFAYQGINDDDAVYGTHALMAAPLNNC